MYRAAAKQRLIAQNRSGAPVALGGVFSLLLFGCTGGKNASEPFQPTQTQVNRTQPNPAQTTPTQPNPADTSSASSPQPSSATTVPFQPNQTQPNQTQPNQTQPNQTQPNQTQPNQTQPNQTQTVKTQTIQTQTVPFQPTQVQVIQAQQQLGAHVTERQIRIILPADVLFDFDKATIRPDAAAALRQTLTVIRYYKAAPIRIEGHTDSKGSDAYNQTLSEQRSQAVQQWLVAQGSVLASRLTMQGFGESKPRAPNSKSDGSDDPAGRQLNRRVEIIVQK